MANEQNSLSRSRKQNNNKSGKLQARRDQRYEDAVARAKANLKAADKAVLADPKNEALLAVRNKAAKTVIQVTRKADRK